MMDAGLQYLTVAKTLDACIDILVDRDAIETDPTPGFVCGTRH
jgi:hypothetical protein